MTKAQKHQKLSGQSVTSLVNCTWEKGNLQSGEFAHAAASQPLIPADALVTPNSKSIMQGHELGCLYTTTHILFHHLAL